MSQTRRLDKTQVGKKLERGSGIFLPIFSLPSNGGIGTLGKEAYEFIDFLEKCKQKYWQILPLGHTGYGDSPYSCYSFFAGNPLFIDFEILKKDGIINNEIQLPDELKAKVKNNSRVDYGEVITKKYKQLRFVYKNCNNEKTPEILKFIEENNNWIYEYGVFMALKNNFEGKPIWEWPEKLRVKDDQIIGKYWNQLRNDINFYMFIQYLFFKQWKELKEYANRKGIKIIGDMPIYPAADSCDVWTHPELFKVDKEELTAKYFSGVPGEGENDPGQNWGNPVYNWQENKESGYSFWKERYEHNMKLYDIIRLDHFRGYANYWEIPVESKTPKEGMWKLGPGMDLFNNLYNEFGELNCIAEDLGNLDEVVFNLIKESGFPGMKVMIYGLHDYENNMYLPHNWTQNSVAYLATHDSETLLEAISYLSKEDKIFANEYVGKPYSIEDLTDCFIRTIYQSPANIVILQMQDLLRLGKEGRINLPGTACGNWSWRINKNEIDEELISTIQDKLATMVKIYKR